MKQRPLGSTDIRIGEIGLGCWQFGGDFGPMEKKTAMSILDEAVNSGITFFDTADVYGAGRSESIIGEFLKETENKVTVATKFGRGPKVYPNHYSEKALRQATDASLKRLKMERIDLTQLHCVPISVLQDGEIFHWLRKLQEEGKIKHFGASVETVEEGLLCMEQEGIASLQIIFNLLRQKPLYELLPQAKEKGVGIIVRLPLASGLLSGKFTKSTSFVETDHRNFNRDGQHFNVGETFSGLPFPKGVELVDRIKDKVPEGMTMAQLSLRWILDQEAVSVVIPGASSPAQVRANAQSSELGMLSQNLQKWIASYYESQVKNNIRGPY